MYFSSGTFYSATFGDLVPINWQIKLIAQIELFISAAIHIIILGDLLSRRIEKSLPQQER